MLNLFVVLAGLVILIASACSASSCRSAGAPTVSGQRIVPPPKVHIARGLVGRDARRDRADHRPGRAVRGGPGRQRRRRHQLRLRSRRSRSSPGLHFVIPIYQRVTNVDTRVQPHAVPGDRRGLEGAPDRQADRRHELPHRWPVRVRPVPARRHGLRGEDHRPRVQRLHQDRRARLLGQRHPGQARRDPDRSRRRSSRATSPSTTSSWTTSTSRTSRSRTRSSRRSRPSRSPSSRSRPSSRSSPSSRSRPSRPSPRRRARPTPTSPSPRARRRPRSPSPRARRGEQAPRRLAERPDPPIPVHPEADRQDHGDAPAVRQPDDLRPEGPARPGRSQPVGIRRPITAT